jgi:hypothetical protein
VTEDSRSVEGFQIASLNKIADRNQIWSRMAAKYGVGNRVPPWKSSLDGICDALDRATSIPTNLRFDRRKEEDELTATVYANLPYPENQLLSLAHSLVVHGVIDETELRERIASVRARLEA